MWNRSFAKLSSFGQGIEGVRTGGVWGKGIVIAVPSEKRLVRVFGSGFWDI
jgi:hypothetical protein